VMTRAIAILLLLAGAASTAAGFVALERMEVGSNEDHLIYMPSGRYLKVASLGHSALAADLVYLWAIQHYSNYERTDRYKFVEHVFGNVIAELDPAYTDAYSLGAMILSVEARDLEGALRLLDLGISRNPENWILPYVAGWECFHADRFEQAGEYFRISSNIPGAPDLISRNQAGALSRSGDLAAAYTLWRDLYEDPDSDATTLVVAERQMRDLHVKIDKKTIQDAAREYRDDTGHWPASLQAMVTAGLMSRVPADPDGNDYPYDPATGQAGSSDYRILGDL
jgi:tetratricopeptide (TPR) repeat protein